MWGPCRAAQVVLGPGARDLFHLLHLAKSLLQGALPGAPVQPLTALPSALGAPAPGAPAATSASVGSYTFKNAMFLPGWSHLWANTLKDVTRALEWHGQGKCNT